MFVFGDFNVHHKDWLIYSVGTDRPCELCYNFSTLLRWLTFLLGSLAVTLAVLLFWIYFFLLTLLFVLQGLYLQWEILILLLSQFCDDFPSNAKWDVPFHRIAYDYSRSDWESLRVHFRDVPWEDIFKLSASAAASEFCDWVQVGINAYIPHNKY